MCSLDSCAFVHCETDRLWHGGRCVCKRGPDFPSLEILIASIFAFRSLDQIDCRNIHSGYISVNSYRRLFVASFLFDLARASQTEAPSAPHSARYHWLHPHQARFHSASAYGGTPFPALVRPLEPEKPASQCPDRSSLSSYRCTSSCDELNNSLSQDESIPLGHNMS